MNQKTSESPLGVMSEPSAPPRMTVVGEKQIPDPSPISSQSTTSPTTMASIAASISTRDREQAAREAWRQGILGSLHVISAVLAIRLILFVAIIGAIGLTFLVIETPDPWRLGALGIYTAVVCIPVIWLASRR